MQQRLREARIESLARSVDRRNRHEGVFARLFRRNGRNGHPSTNGDGGGHGNGRLRRGHAEIDFHDRGEDVWAALRD